MNKNMLIIMLSLICMLPTQKLVGVGDNNRKDVGYYNCLPIEKCVSKSSEKSKSVIFLRSPHVNKKMKQEFKNKMRECAHSEQAIFGDKVKDLAHDCWPDVVVASSFLAPLAVACWWGVVDAVMPVSFLEK